MLAVVKEGPGPGFALREVPRPEVQPGTVIVRVKAVGICGTDIPIFDGIRRVPYPLIPGHEIAGVIDEVGPGVEGWQVGDRVVVGLVVGCGTCEYCRRGDEPLCPNIRELGIHVDGGYAEYLRAPVSTLHRLPDDMTFVQGASADPVASSYRGIRRLRINPEDRVVIFGPGPIGLYALQAVAARSPRVLMMVGRSLERLEIAQGLGATHVFSTRQGDVAEAVAQATGGRMATVVIEATGNPAVMPDLLRVAARGARLLLVGIFHDPATVHLDPVVRHELQVMGTFCYNWNDLEASIDLLRRGLVRTDGIVTHVLPLADMGKALELIKSRQAIKVILEP